jgi:hypothetical protein
MAFAISFSVTILSFQIRDFRFLLLKLDSANFTRSDTRAGRRKLARGDAGTSDFQFQFKTSAGLRHGAQTAPAQIGHHAG